MKKNRFFIDGHQDIAYSILANNRPLDTNDSKYMITLKETLKSKLGLIFSTIFVSHVKRDKRHLEALLQFKEYEKIFKNYGFFYKVKNNKDIKLKTKNKIGLLFLMEGADPIRKLNDLEMFYNKGLRILGLTWNKENNYAFGASKSGPLKKEGYQLIESMNELGVTLDLSHLSYKSFWDAINSTKLIPIATHSNSYYLRRHKRNLTASQLKAISNKDDVFKQFNYLLSKCGEDHIALGSDIDGAPLEDFPKGIKKSSDLSKVIELLEKKKIKPKIIDKFAGMILLRVLKANLS